MTSRRFFLHLLQVFGLISPQMVAGETQGQFWFLRAANEIADPLVDAVEQRKIPPAELVSNVKALIDQKKVQELARFDQILGGEMIRRQNLTGEMRCPNSEEKMDLGVTMEADVTLAADSRRADIRFAPEIYEKKSRDEYIQTTRNFAVTIFGDPWELAGIWKDAKESTLALVRIQDYPVAAAAVRDKPETELHVELLEIQPDDLLQFRKSTAETRPKAVMWLRARAKVLAATRSKILPGQSFSHEDVVANFEGERGGFTLRAEQMTTPGGEKTDLMLTAEWQDPEKPAIEEEYQFKVGETFGPWQTELFEPSIAPKSKGPLPVLLVTIQITPPKVRPEGMAAQKDPASLPEKISTVTHPVAPKFIRIIQGFRDPNKRPGLKEALSQRGLEFPQGTSVAMGASSSEVTLTHNREGHVKFAALLKELDLLP